jgi:hypothetical protein
LAAVITTFARLPPPAYSVTMQNMCGL